MILVKIARPLTTLCAADEYLGFRMECIAIDGDKARLFTCAEVFSCSIFFPYLGPVGTRVRNQAKFSTRSVNWTTVLNMGLC